MMKKTWKKLAVLAVLVMAFGVFPACGTPDDSSSSAPAESSISQVSSYQSQNNFRLKLCFDCKFTSLFFS